VPVPSANWCRPLLTGGLRAHGCSEAQVRLVLSKLGKIRFDRNTDRSGLETTVSRYRFVVNPFPGGRR